MGTNCAPHGRDIILSHQDDIITAFHNASRCLDNLLNADNNHNYFQT
jgi:hypothetical protein